MPLSKDDLEHFLRTGKTPEAEALSGRGAGPMDEYAKALGHICMGFSQIESTLHLYIELLIPCSQDVRRAIVDAAGTSVKARVELVRKLGAISFPAPLFEKLDKLLTKIADDIVAKRNRFVHDIWSWEGTGMPPAQWDERAPLRKAQSHQAKTLAESERIERPISSMWELTEKITEAMIDLNKILGDWLQLQKQQPQQSP